MLILELLCSHLCWEALLLEIGGFLLTVGVLSLTVEALLFTVAVCV